MVTARVTCGEGIEAHRELRGDLAHALGVGRAHLRGLVAEPQQQLLVGRRRLDGSGGVVGTPGGGRR